MRSHQENWICLIRAIGGSTHKKMSMAQLRSACSEMGLKDVRTLLATGNIVFSSEMPIEGILKVLHGVIAKHGLRNEVFLRRTENLRAILAENPFPDAAMAHPSHMIVLFLNKPTSIEDAAAVAQYDGPERIVVKDRESYIDYTVNIATSKLTPVRLEKLLGQSGTARNWNTVQKLADAASF